MKAIQVLQEIKCWINANLVMQLWLVVGSWLVLETQREAMLQHLKSNITSKIIWQSTILLTLLEEETRGSIWFDKCHVTIKVNASIWVILF